ncbi:MAG: hypothetical protein ACMUHX_04520 [bacterium]
MEKEQTIETLILWNFWEKGIDTGISREEYLTLLKRFLATDEIVTLTGVRRSDKSTLLLLSTPKKPKKRNASWRNLRFG